jgi:hypothetical protein
MRIRRTLTTHDCITFGTEGIFNFFGHAFSVHIDCHGSVDMGSSRGRVEKERGLGSGRQQRRKAVMAGDDEEQTGSRQQAADSSSSSSSSSSISISQRDT